MKRNLWVVSIVVALSVATAAAAAPSRLEKLEARVAQLEAENTKLKAEIVALKAAAATATTTKATAAPKPPAQTAGKHPQHDGMVLSIVDGDTLVVAIGKKKVRVRLLKGDAPEKGEPGIEEAKKALAKKFPPGSKVVVTEYARDELGRIMGTVEKWKRPMPYLYQGKPQTDEWFAAAYKQAQKQVAWVDGKPVIVKAIKKEDIPVISTTPPKEAYAVRRRAGAAVDEILNGAEVIVRQWFRPARTQRYPAERGGTRMVTVTVESAKPEVLFLLSHVDTKGWTDGMPLKKHEYLIYLGTTKGPGARHQRYAPVEWISKEQLDKALRDGFVLPGLKGK